MTELHHDEQADIQGLGALIRTVNQHFLCLPAPAFVEFVRSEDHRNTLAVLAEGEFGAIAKGAALMDAFLANTVDVDADELSQTLGVDRTRLYRGVTPGYSAPYPAEAVWLHLEDRRAARLFEELNMFYGSHGMRVAPDANERPDYVGVQLDFLAHLADKATAAWEANDAEQAAALEEAMENFATRHLAWLPEFVEVACPLARTDFYRGHLRMAEGLVALIADPRATA